MCAHKNKLRYQPDEKKDYECACICGCEGVFIAQKWPAVCLYCHENVHQELLVRTIFMQSSSMNIRILYIYEMSLYIRVLLFTFVSLSFSGISFAFLLFSSFFPLLSIVLKIYGPYVNRRKPPSISAIKREKCSQTLFSFSFSFSS